MSKPTCNLRKISEEAGQVLGEMADLFEAEGKEVLPLTPRVRRLHKRLPGNGREGDFAQ